LSYISRYDIVAEILHIGKEIILHDIYVFIRKKGNIVKITLYVLELLILSFQYGVGDDK